MRNDVITYKFGSFTDFKGIERMVIACVASMSISENAMTASWTDDSESYDLVRAVSIGVSVYNPDDEFDLSVGKKIALNRAYHNDPSYFIVKGGHLDDNITDAMLTNAIENFKKHPETIIKGYKEAAKKYAEIQDSKAFVDKADDAEMAIVDALEAGVNVLDIVKKAKPYLNAFKTDSNLVN